jgi:DNA replication protein DnaC
MSDQPDLEELAARALVAREYAGQLAEAMRLQLLTLDEVGFVPFIAALHEQLSLLVTTTVPFAEWVSLFGGDQRLTAALLDRLTFHAHVLQFSGDSFRLRHSLKRQEEARQRRH